MVAIGPQSVWWKVVVNDDDVELKEWVIDGGDAMLNANGTEKEKPGGIVVVDGQWTSKCDGEEGDGDGKWASVESGVKETGLENWES